METPWNKLEVSEEGKQFHQKVDDMVSKLIADYTITRDQFTEQQVGELVKQLLLSGDIFKLISPSGGKMMYHPYEIRQKYNELLHAVSFKHEGESRHDTALRYILSCEKPNKPASESK